MIPISLVLSRSRSFANFPLLPLMFAWPGSPPVPTAALRIGTTGWNIFGGRGDADLPYGPIFGWPPSPMMASMLFPLIGRLYREQHAKVVFAILGKQETRRGPVRDIVWDLGGPDVMPFRARLGLVVDPVEQQQQQEAQQRHEQREQLRQDQDQEPQARQDIEGQEQPADGPAERTVRVTNASLGRAIGGALALPMIASCMGSLLKQLSRISPTLRTFLALRPPLTGQRRVSLLGPWLDSQGFAQMHWLKKVGMGLHVALNIVCGGTRVWYEADPVWWRNSVGLGLFMVVSNLAWIGRAACSRHCAFQAKDCAEMLHLYLAKREFETRRIKNRPFEGVDLSQLDLIHPIRAPVPAPLSASDTKPPDTPIPNLNPLPTPASSDITSDTESDAGVTVDIESDAGATIVME